MIATPKCLYEAAYATNADATIYTAPTGTTTIVDKFTATNVTGSSRTITVNIVPAGGAVGTNNIIVSALSVAAGATADLTEIQNQILTTGDQISVKADANSAVVVRGSGRECA